ncbi:transposase [endosymbiont of Ridgeia piscesae]|uniref:transposase n=1 Tax=endosymbiont of Ridgeia piscesae TaxID=54398 RepID=UPI000761EE19|nr:transposase [endosymbiont of Ridgeia piscesae]
MILQLLSRLPTPQIQLCIAHQVHLSLRYINWKQRKKVAAKPHQIYATATLANTEQVLDAFTDKRDERTRLSANPRTVTRSAGTYSSTTHLIKPKRLTSKNDVSLLFGGP